MRVILSTILDEPSVIDPKYLFIPLMNIMWSNCAKCLDIAISYPVFHREEVLECHDQYIGVIFLLALNVMSEIVRTGHPHGVTLVNVVSIGVIVRNYSEQSRVLGLVGKKAH